jgi:hypothetical protein
MTYDEIKDRLLRISQDLRDVLDVLPRGGDRPRRAVANRVGRAFADIMDAYSRICVNETFTKGLKHDEQD